MELKQLVAETIFKIVYVITFATLTLIEYSGALYYKLRYKMPYSDCRLAILQRALRRFTW